MGRRISDARKEIVELLEGRPGWRLEPRTTPGASPMWCFVSEGEIEFSVAAEGGVIHLYRMATDEELAFRDAISSPPGSASTVTRWKSAAATEGQERARRFFEWG